MGRIQRIFGFYGDIKKMERLTIRQTDVRNSDYAGKPNGNIKIRMKMRKPIPSNLSIDGRMIEIYYRNQVRTCWRCGLGHKKADCRTHSSEFTNHFSYDDFPDLNPTRSRHASMEDGTPVLDRWLARVLLHPPPYINAI